MIVIVMTCYAPGPERAEYAPQVLTSLIKHLKVPDAEDVRLHIADDGSYEQVYLKELMAEATRAWGTHSSFTDAKNHGIGASLNLAMRLVRSQDLWLYITDDWVLTRKLDLRVPVWLIREMHRDYVRLGPMHPDLTCHTRHHDGKWWLDINHACSGFSFGTRPFLANRKFVELTGKFDEDLDAYDTERLYAERVHHAGMVRLASIELGHGPWKHIGDYEVGDLKPNARREHEAIYST